MGIPCLRAEAIRSRTYLRLNMHAPQWIIRSYAERSCGKSLPLAVSILIPCPNLLRSIPGILTLPMSSAAGAWVQASAIRTLELSLRRSIAFAPWVNVLISPLYAAKRTEKEVMRHPSGLAAMASGNA